MMIHEYNLCQSNLVPKQLCYPQRERHKQLKTQKKSYVGSCVFVWSTESPDGVDIIGFT